MPRLTSAIMGRAVGKIWKSPCGRMELRLGKWQDALADVTECDAVITDPPYSAKTHAGRRTGSEIQQSSIKYQHITDIEIREAMRFLACRVRGWFVIFGDDQTQSMWRYWMALQNLYVFASVPWCKPDAAPRMTGDGPASQTEWLSIARPRKMPARRGSRPGFYVGSIASTRGSNGSKAHPGQKPIGLMRRLVCDYSEPDDVILDPYAGLGTTLLAAAIEGRRAIGAECDPETFAKAVKRLSAGYTPRLFQAASPKQKQETLL